MNITSNTKCPDNGTRKLVEEVVLNRWWQEKDHPQPGQAEVLLVKWLMLLQLLTQEKKVTQLITTRSLKKWKPNQDYAIKLVAFETLQEPLLNV